MLHQEISRTTWWHKLSMSGTLEHARVRGVFAESAVLEFAWIPGGTERFLGVVRDYKMTLPIVMKYPPPDSRYKPYYTSDPCKVGTGHDGIPPDQARSRSPMANAVMCSARRMKGELHPERIVRPEAYLLSCFRMTASFELATFLVSTIQR